MSQHSSSRDLDAYRRRDTPLAAFMFYLSLAFLVLVAGLLYTHQTTEHAAASLSDDDLRAIAWDAIELRIQLYGLALLWPIFLVEALGTFLTRDRRLGFWKPLTWFFLVCVAPPARIAGRVGDTEIWLPRLGWRFVDRDLRRTLERFFSIPMIVIALMVLPLLAIEYGWHAHVASRPGLRLFLEIANSGIWMAFAVEFLIMIAVAEKRLRYCALHWVDLAIILLPVVTFLITVIRNWAELAPLARSLRLLRLSQLSRMGRVYRMQGLALKAWRAFLVLQVIQRLMGRSLEKQLKHLEELLIAKEEEVVELRTEIDDLKKQIAAQKLAQTQAEHIAGEPAIRVSGRADGDIQIDTPGKST